MSKNNTILEWINTQEKQMLTELKSWVNHNTYSENTQGLISFAKILEKRVKRLGGTLKTHQLSSIKTIDSNGSKKEIYTGPILHIVKRPKAKTKILLSIHYDTVFPKESSFQHVKKINATTFQGPGIIDAKGGLQILLTAVEAFEKSKNKENVGWEIILSPDEEIGSPKSAAFLTKRAKHCDYGLVFEPNLPDGAFVSERMGSANLKVIAKGKAAHVGRAFKSGENAILALTDFIQAYRDINKGSESIINFGVIKGGTASNVVPDFATLDINIRDKKKVTMIRQLKLIQTIISALNKKKPAKLSLFEKSIRVPKPFTPKTKKLFNDFKKISDECGFEFKTKPTGGVCDGNILNDAGLPTIDTLGAMGSGIHTSKESLIASSLTQKTMLCYLFLESQTTKH
ncbi:hypothetical protein DID80_02615 [Candidatus Marinamargulisbacteria bacterium SCGC AAA071-K20]|nr:hypothetical protein DID80_02615 [Candidatus Marinamargulisbacteria bacterium SCGC AAA071-K20]